jgi:predicted MFS family arabinose efflux permease
MLTIATGAYLAGRSLDAGVSARTVASVTGLLMLIPAAIWAWAMRAWRQEPSNLAAESQS